MDKTNIKDKLWHSLTTALESAGKAIAKFFSTIWTQFTLPLVETVRGKGVARRWITTTFLAFGLLMAVILAVSISVINSYYYDTIQQILIQRITFETEYFSEVNGSTISNYNTSSYFLAAQSFVENFEDKDTMEMQFINSSGTVIVSSSGFEPATDIVMPDYEYAVDSDEIEVWSGYNENDEHVMAVCSVLNGSSSNGAIRLIVSLAPVDDVVANLIVFVIMGIMLILTFILLSSTYFIRSVVKPVRSITATAGQIANGDFTIRLTKEHDDEIGDLVDSINAMAAQLALSENIKNDFLSSVSHELKTPLTAIKGWSETIVMSINEGDKDMVTRGMGIINRESDRLAQLVEQLLDFSRMQSGQLRSNPVDVDIISEIDDVVFIYRDKVKKESKRITFYSPEKEIYVSCDKNMLRQVILIIIDNAIKYSYDGGEILISTNLTDDSVTMIVRDFGCGIAADQLPRVKERFYKGNNSKGGFGIGLAVADEIISLHHGSLDISSVEGEGTIVSVTLPVLYIKGGDAEDESKAEGAILQGETEKIEKDDKQASPDLEKK